MKKIYTGVMFLVLLFPGVSFAKTEAEIKSAIIDQVLGVFVMQVNTMDKIQTLAAESTNKGQYRSYLILVQKQLQESITQLSTLLNPPIVVVPKPPLQTTIPGVTIQPMNPEAPAQENNQVAVASAPDPVISASLISNPSVIKIGQDRVFVMEVLITNDTDEAVQFTGNQNSYVSLVENTIDTFSLSISAIYNNLDVNSSMTIPAHKSGTLKLLLNMLPQKVGTFKVQFANYKMNGITSGNIISLSGMPLTTGTITVE